MQWHVLAGGPEGNAYAIAFHVPIPSANNAVGVNYQTALVNSGVGGRSVMPTGTGAGQITAAELANVQNGSIFEVVEPHFTNPGQSLGQEQADLDARFAALSSVNGALIKGLQNQLLYFGATSVS